MFGSEDHVQHVRHKELGGSHVAPAPGDRQRQPSDQHTELGGHARNTGIRLTAPASQAQQCRTNAGREHSRENMPVRTRAVLKAVQSACTPGAPTPASSVHALIGSPRTAIA